MLHPPEVAGASVSILNKDTRLFREAAESEHVQTPLADLFYTHWQKAMDAGMQDQDLPSAYYEISQRMLKDKG